MLHSPHAKTGRQLSAGQHVRAFALTNKPASLAQEEMQAHVWCAVQAAAFDNLVKDSVTCPAVTGAQSMHIHSFTD